MQKRFRTFIAFSLFSILIIACDENNDLSPKYPDTIIGCWTNPQLNDTIWIFDKTNKLPENGYGFEFKYNNKFIEIKNSGWCATPPIAYIESKFVALKGSPFSKG
ncbi:MAG: hypothetical protein PF486_05435 [Prolixibacteraceae bacterium]|jgi:hypothetical protein|nr:hypothetical protein [Prolixibacteraceae bacterium]